MFETISQNQFDTAAGKANDFMLAERGTSLDGGFAAGQVAGRTETVAAVAEAMLTATPFPGRAGYFLPLSKHNAERYDQAVATLPGYIVLVPSSLVTPGSRAFYPAVVSEDGTKTSKLRLHVLEQPYRQDAGISNGMAVILSGAGQAETKGVGDHGRQVSDGVEAEHFPTLLATAADPGLLSAWQAGNHINHTWRAARNNSVTSQVSQRLLGAEFAQQTITLGREQFVGGKAMLLWHDSMRDTMNGRPETATRQNALVVVQGLGFQALKQASPKGLDNVKRMIA